MNTVQPEEIARQLASMRKPKHRICPVCTKPFTTIGRGVYCSPACRAKAHYYQHKEEILRKRRARHRNRP